MNKLNKELLQRALVEGVDTRFDGDHVSLASTENNWNDGFHITNCDSDDKYFQYVCTKEEYLAAKAKKDKPAQPVFTQAMADAGELPQVGMMVETSTGECEILLPWSDGGFSVVTYNGEYYFCCLAGCKPIDTRTKKEKAIDELVLHAVGEHKSIARAFLSLAYDKWVGK